MSISFSGSELVNIAIGVEKRGIAFYDALAMSTDEATARDIFQRLANMEREHAQIFQNMLVHVREFIQVTHCNTFINLVDGGIERAEFNYLGASRRNKASIGCAASSGEFAFKVLYRIDSSTGGID